ncbi:IS30 family transposase [Rathayibacter rathayi]|uniref:IS30 family transposase n=1 Tax=Rathayibacter rathayi TaxID=33887 RepID=UPI000CE7B124|nr:IS30 family transposase [Rathayibacter rathayi]PPG88510.1 IS30 family transposase [Rathayibacter rathayi]
MSRGVLLSLAEREEISRGIAGGVSGWAIAASLGRDPSVVSREIVRGGGRVEYRAGLSEVRAAQESRRPRLRRVEADPRLLAVVNSGFVKAWSPTQISRRMRLDFPDDHTMRVSNEQLYQARYVQARGQLKVELLGQLRRGGTVRVGRAERRRIVERRHQVIPSMVMITERPPEAEDRAVPGHWEGDLIMGAANRFAIITLVERTTRFVILRRLNHDQTAARVAGQLTSGMRDLPALLKQSLTWDQGREMAAHKKFTTATGIPVFFCDPHSPWQRGTNENTNGLLREHFPKGTELKDYTQNYLDAVARDLNGRPRQTLEFRTPAEKLALLLEE